MLAAQEKDKKVKYLKSCHALQKNSTPLVYNVDWIAGREAKSVEKYLATAFAEKRNKPSYSEMVFYVCVMMALAVVRANSLLIHGSRDCQQACGPVINDYASIYYWRTWHNSKCSGIAYNSGNLYASPPNNPHYKSLKLVPQSYGPLS